MLVPNLDTIRSKQLSLPEKQCTTYSSYQVSYGEALQRIIAMVRHCYYYFLEVPSLGI